ncbi:MAG: hypothetical protein RBT65_18520 [Methanolobus sp.]|nr:hypothetical protein [Methanolobus sp.]
MGKKKSINSLWLPINLWNLNEVFTTESISPISFYAIRDFGNPVNRNEGKFEDANYLVLFEEQVESEIIIEIYLELFDKAALHYTKTGYCEYYKTIYLQKGYFKVYFDKKEKLQEFLNQQFMLLEVKTVNKYKSESFVISENKSKHSKQVSYQPKILSEQSEKEPFFDKAFNQIKGLIYGYIIGSLGSLDENEQGLVSDLTKLKNTIGGVHTDIALSEQYSNFWLINVKKQIRDCEERFKKQFGNKTSDVFSTLSLRLQEVDSLNKMRCEELSKQKSPSYKRDYETEQENLEQARRNVYLYECKHNITPLKEEFEKIKQEEKERGEAKGKKREYYKKEENPEKYYRKQDLKNEIEVFEKNDYEYRVLKNNVYALEDRIKNFQQGGTQFDTSINEQFNRITEQLNDIVKRTNNYFLSKNNKESVLPDISFKIDLDLLTNYYLQKNISYTDFSIQSLDILSEELSVQEIDLLKISLNSVLSFPQGRLGNYSEENVLKIIAEIGKHLPDGDFKNTLREYYLYRTDKSDNFVFPENDILASIIVFLMKLQGHDQINKMLIAKSVKNKNVAFMLYGAYAGFANLPKTFTNLIFDSENHKLQYFIDNYLFNTLIKSKS